MYVPYGSPFPVSPHNHVAKAPPPWQGRQSVTWLPPSGCPGNWDPAALAAQGGLANSMSHPAGAWGSDRAYCCSPAARQAWQTEKSITSKTSACFIDGFYERQNFWDRLCEKITGHWLGQHKFFRVFCWVFSLTTSQYFWNVHGQGECLSSLCMSFQRKGTQIT